jgi:hypothetical protein
MVGFEPTFEVISKTATNIEHIRLPRYISVLNFKTLVIFLILYDHFHNIF